jgi:hypothetical protein
MMDIIHFNEMTKLLDLDGVIKYRDKHNTSGELPYHGNLHMNFMLADCFNAYLYDRLWDRGNGPVVEFPAIFYAAIFHDVDHSGGKLTDNLNVDKAIAAWHTFVDSDEGKDLLPLDFTHQGKHIRGWVPVLIRATQYPYVDITESSEYKAASVAYVASLTESCNVLRDADLMTIYHGHQGEELVNVGLFEEMSPADSVYGPMTYAEFQTKSIAFLTSIKWHTVWGKRRAVIMNYPYIRNVVINRSIRRKFQYDE